jgi:hypothetical protein
MMAHAPSPKAPLRPSTSPGMHIQHRIKSLFELCKFAATHAQIINVEHVQCQQYAKNAKHAKRLPAGGGLVH